jgi:hypothetical protein
MKRIFVLSVLFCLFQNIFAQTITVNELKSIKDGAKVNYILDFTDCIIMGTTITDFAVSEPDWDNDKPTIVNSFRNGILSQVEDFMILGMGNLSDAPYTLTVHVKSISSNGYLICDANLTDTDGKIYLAVSNVNSGKKSKLIPGTKLSKIKASSLLAGRSLGKIIKSERK